MHTYSDVSIVYDDAFGYSVKSGACILYCMREYSLRTVAFVDRREHNVVSDRILSCNLARIEKLAKVTRHNLVS